MKPFIVYEVATGRITRTGVCQDDMVSAQAHEGEAVMTGFIRDDPTEFYVDTSGGEPELKRVA